MRKGLVFLSLFLIVITLSFASCGNDTSSPETDGSTTQSQAPETYTIAYEKNGGTEDGILASTFTKNDLPLSLNSLSDKDGQVFAGWYKESDFSGEPVLSITDAKSITLYAKYETCTPGILFKEANGGWSVSDYTGTASNVTIPSMYKGKPVTQIGLLSFSQCENLTGVTIPNSVTKIDSRAFFCCKNLANISFPESVITIGESAFLGCSKLTSIVLPENLTSLGNGAFSECYNIESVDLGNKINSIGEATFKGCSKLARIEIPSSVTYISCYAFTNCSSLTTIFIPCSVTGMNESVFGGCTSLTISCEAASKPNGWAEFWNDAHCPVKWNQQLSEQ